MYEYQATLIAVHDGDTVTLDVDLGMDVQFTKRKMRLAHINAPELATPEGKAARTALLTQLPPVGSTIRVDTILDRTEKYGRYLAVLWVGTLNVNQWMLDNGYAVPYEGGAR